MELAKATELQETIAESFISQPSEGSRHFGYIEHRSARPYWGLKTDLNEMLYGTAVIPTNDGWGVKLYTDGNISASDLKGYFGRKADNLLIDNIGPITILSKPLPGEYICYPRGSVGTLAAYVADASGKPHILSNNHVLSNFCKGNVGDNILHPGQIDTGSNVLARVTTLVPIDFSKDKNELDCGLAELVNFSDDNSSLPGIGKVPGVVDATNGMGVEKNGYTTKLTRGVISSTSAIIKVDYGSGFFRRKTATFRGQIEIKPVHPHPLFSDIGDSGSLLVETVSGKATGLLFAGSTNGTSFANSINKVLKTLLVEIL